MYTTTLPQFVANYDKGEQVAENPKALATAAELTPDELKALWKIEKWINTKIPTLMNQAGLSDPDWSIKCRAFKPLAFEPARSAEAMASKTHKTRFVVINRTDLPLFISKNSDKQDLRDKWEDFWQEFGDKEYSITLSHTVSAGMIEKIKGFTPEQKQQLFEGCASSHREWTNSLPETPEAMREAINNLPLKQAFKRLMEAYWTQDVYDTKQELKATLTHECGHLYNRDFAKTFKTEIIWTFLPPQAVMWAIYLVAILFRAELTDLLGALLPVIPSFIQSLSTMKKITAYHGKLRELGADEFVHKLSTKYCAASVPIWKDSLAVRFLMERENSNLRASTSWLAFSVHVLSRLGSVANVFGRIFSPITARIESLYLKIIGIKPIENPETIVPGGIQEFTRLPHLEPATRWLKFREWSQKAE